MELEILNPYVLKILISARKEDSINSISQRIGLSYGWTYKWIKELSELGVFRLSRMKAYLNEKSDFYIKTLKFVKETLFPSVEKYYEFPKLFGISYCFTGTDAVYVWTKGGYNIGRYRDFYPIFVKIKNTDKGIFESYCNKLSLKINSNIGVFYNVEYCDDFEYENCEGFPVDKLDLTINFMKKNIYNFQPALEMIKEMYGKKIKVKYKEVITNNPNTKRIK